jgi:hypothetical protein
VSVPIDVEEPRDDLVLLSNASMRARNRPRTVALLWVWESLLALGVAWPIASLVGASYGGDPRGDAVLWERGGFALVDLVLRSHGALRALAASVIVVALIAAIGGLFPASAALTSIAYTTRERTPPRMRDLVGRATRASRSFVVLLVVTTILQLLLVGAGYWFASVATYYVAPRAGVVRGDEVAWIVVALFAALALVCGVAHDLARAAVVRFRVEGMHGFALGLNVMRRGVVAPVWSWAWRAFVGAALLLVGSVVAERFGGKGGLALVALVVVHQAVVVARVALRASWLAKALRSVDEAHRVVRPTVSD